MEITPQLQNTLKNIYSGLNNTFKEDCFNTDKFKYTDSEVSPSVSAHAFTEHMHFTRLSKIKNFKNLMDNWDSFKEQYQNDPIMAKIGVEILENKMFFDAQVLKDIQEYPNRKEVLFYFKKGQQVNLPDIKPEEYTTFCATILEEVGQFAQEKLDFKKILLTLIEQLRMDKSYNNLQYLTSLTCGTKTNGKIDCHNDDVLSAIKNNILLSNFKAEEHDGKYFVELPIKGTQFDNNVAVNCNTILLQINKINPKEYCIEVAAMPKTRPSLFIISDLRTKKNPSSENTANLPKPI